MNLALTGTGELARLVLRRDRVRLPAWVLGLGGLVAWSAVGVQSVYDTPAKVAGYAATVGTSPVSRLMSGRQAGIDTIGGITANEISQVAQLGVCLMVTFLVVRHTRGDEESGRSELLRSGVVGRHAATLTALLYAVAAAVAVGGITAASMLGVGLGTTGTVAYAVGLVLLGACFAAVALVAAQLTSSARTALALAGAAVGVAYLVRGLGAIRDDALVWLSPFGWAQEMQAFGTERWWPAGLLVVATAARLAGAAWLEPRRDHGGALLHPAPGRPAPRDGSPPPSRSSCGSSEARSSAGWSVSPPWPSSTGRSSPRSPTSSPRTPRSGSTSERAGARRRRSSTPSCATSCSSSRSCRRPSGWPA
ncbi:hypothetical protein [Janibacter melonis]|uniref:hypothetical protein n=1 Tax=Janibacter melonis TaxID=262209 RepID=UPI002096558F|nr:hypothetical protein [Janibacter melonis]